MFKKLSKVKCLGHKDDCGIAGWDFTCDYENAPWACEGCVCNDGYTNPETGKIISWVQRKFQDFKAMKKWEYLHKRQTIKEIQDSLNSAYDGLNEYAETLSDTYSCSQHLDKINELLKQL